jgi:hypothetical protein
MRTQLTDLVVRNAKPPRVGIDHHMGHQSSWFCCELAAEAEPPMIEILAEARDAGTEIKARCASALPRV